MSVSSGVSDCSRCMLLSLSQTSSLSAFINSLCLAWSQIRIEVNLAPDIHVVRFAKLPGDSQQLIIGRGTFTFLQNIINPLFLAAHHCLNDTLLLKGVHFRNYSIKLVVVS